MGGDLGHGVIEGREEPEWYGRQGRIRHRPDDEALPDAGDQAEIASEPVRENPGVRVDRSLDENVHRDTSFPPEPVDPAPARDWLHGQEALVREEDEQRDEEPARHADLKSDQGRRRCARRARRLQVHGHGDDLGGRAEAAPPRRPTAADGSYDGLAAVCALTSIAEAQALANE
jgi:hypothetical protein